VDMKGSGTRGESSKGEGRMDESERLVVLIVEIQRKRRGSGREKGAKGS